jgi:hypothetical protein
MTRIEKIVIVVLGFFALAFLGQIIGSTPKSQTTTPVAAQAATTTNAAAPVVSLPEDKPKSDLVSRACRNNQDCERISRPFINSCMEARPRDTTIAEMEGRCAIIFRDMIAAELRRRDLERDNAR